VASISAIPIARKNRLAGASSTDPGTNGLELWEVIMTGVPGARELG
jgi:hypothetical protein